MKTYTEKEVESLLKLAVSTTMEATVKWFESDEVIIQDKDSKQEIANAQINVKGPITLTRGFVFPALKEVGITYSMSELSI